MSRPDGGLPDSLRPARGHIDLLRPDELWNAVSMPAMWGHVVLERLGDYSGAVIEDFVLRRLTWIVPAGGVEDWPTVPACDLVVHRTHGAQVTVPDPEKTVGGVRWVRRPERGRVFTTPVTLLLVVERVIGPLDKANALGPVVVCEECRAVTRDAVKVAEATTLSGPPRVTYLCREGEHCG